MGRVPIKGLTEPVEIHRVTGRRRRTRLEVSAERGLSRLVGREQELSLLRDCFARVRVGRGQMVGVVGEAGVGKSRLVHELRASLAGERITWLAGHCVAYGQGTPYLPVLEILRANFDVEEGDNPLQIEAKLRQGVRRLDPALESTLPFLRELFLLPADEDFKKLDAKIKRQQTFESIRALTVAGSQHAPLVIADLLAALSDRVVLARLPEGSLGRAYLDGFGVALDGGATIVVQMDADFSHDPAVLHQACGAVVVVGGQPQNDHE